MFLSLTDINFLRQSGLSGTLERARPNINVLLLFFDFKIRECQSKLPENGAPSMSSTPSSSAASSSKSGAPVPLNQRFEDYVHISTLRNWKFWIVRQHSVLGFFLKQQNFQKFYLIIIIFFSISSKHKLRIS